MESFFIKKDVLIGLLKKKREKQIAQAFLCMNELLVKIKEEINISLYEYRDISFYIDGPKRYFEANMAFLNQEIWTNIFNNGLRQIFTQNSDYPPTIYGESSEISNSLLTSGDQIDGKVKNSSNFSRNVKDSKKCCS